MSEGRSPGAALLTCDDPPTNELGLASATASTRLLSQTHVALAPPNTARLSRVNTGYSSHGVLALAARELGYLT